MNKQTKSAALLLRISMIVMLLLGLLALGAPLIAQTRCPGGAVTVTTANVGTVFAANAPGTTYCFTEGTYNNFSITPDDGDQFYSNSLYGAVISGGGSLRIAFNGVTQVGDGGAQIINVRIDGFKFIRYINANIWTGATPNDAALNAYTGWTIVNNLFEGTSSEPMTAAITIAKANWGCAENVTISNNIIRGMTHVAILGNMIQGNITNNTITGNGFGAQTRITAGYSNDANNIEWNGVFKITNNRVGSWTSSGYDCNTTGKVPYVGNNIVERNRWIGIWADVAVTNFLVENNIIRGNSGPAIMHEISRAGTYRFNTTVCNNWEWNNEGWQTGEVVVWDSTNVTISNNQITACGNGDTYTAVGQSWSYASRGGGGAKAIVMQSANRGGTTGIVVSSNNVIVNPGANRAVSFERINNSNTIGVTFTTNTYYVFTLGRSIYNDTAGTSNFTGWQAKGRDTAGSETTSNPPSINPTATPGGATATTTSTPTATPTQPGSGCYTTTCPVIPGRIELENYNFGASGVAFNDQSPGNWFNEYRTTTDVDVKSITGGFAIGFGEAGDWTNYTVTVNTTGYYTMYIRMASADTASVTRTVTVTVDSGVIGGGAVTVPQVETWGMFEIVTVNNIYLASGSRTLRFTINHNYTDADYIEFALSTGVTNTPTVTPTASTTPTPSSTPTPSNTPVPPTAVPSNTPSPTVVRPVALATLEAGLFPVQTQLATTRSARTDLQATRNAAATAIVGGDRAVATVSACEGRIQDAIEEWYSGNEAGAILPGC